jgi:hypothetical protein
MKLFSDIRKALVGKRIKDVTPRVLGVNGRAAQVVLQMEDGSAVVVPLVVHVDTPSQEDRPK